MANKYLAYVGGRIKEIVALVTSAGAGDAGKIPALDNTGKLDMSLMPTGIGEASKTLNASEAISAPALVNVWNDGGTAKVRKADATSEGKEANGFILASVAENAAATVYFADEITGLTGLTPGARLFLSAATPGAPTATAPSGSGNVVQCIGVAVSTTSIMFQPVSPITLA